MVNVCDFYKARIGKTNTVLLIGPGLEENIEMVGEPLARLPYDPNVLFFATYLKGGKLILFDRSKSDYSRLEAFFSMWRTLGAQLCDIDFTWGDIRLNEERNTVLGGDKVRAPDVTLIDHLTFSRHIAPYILFDMDEGMYPSGINIWDHFAQVYLRFLKSRAGRIMIHFEDSRWQTLLRERMAKAFSGQGCRVEVLEEMEDAYYLEDERIWMMVNRGLITSQRFNLNSRRLMPLFSSKSLLIAEPG